MRICGIDEAGRGPFIGPLVICGATIEKHQEGTILELGVKDSKLLTPKKRAELAAILPKHVDYKIILVEPSEIDAYLAQDGTNLNWLEADKTVEIINTLPCDHAIVDCPSPNIRAYKSYIQERITATIHAQHKADVHYPIAAAASILAKVKRDTLIATLHKEIGIDFGSGYLTDEKTQTFIKKYWKEYPHLLRKSWSTYKTLVANKKQKKLSQF